MKISFVIVAYKSEALLEDCIKSIIKFCKTNYYEIIVIDNSPLENQINTIIICNKFKDNIIYKSNVNLGYGFGNNIGIKMAQNEIVCIINPDVRFIEPFFETVINYFSDKKNSLLGFKQIGGKNLSYYVKPEYYIPFLNSFIVKISNYLNFFHSKIFYLSGACFFISKKNFEEINLFDENIFMYYEEPDISNRLIKEHFKIDFIKKIKYLHLVGNRNKIQENLFEIEFNSWLYYINKYNLNLNLQIFLKKIEYYVLSKDKFKLLFKFLKMEKSNLG